MVLDPVTAEALQGGNVYLYLYLILIGCLNQYLTGAHGKLKAAPSAIQKINPGLAGQCGDSMARLVV